MDRLISDKCKANGNRISGSISTTTKDYIINYQDLQGIGMTSKLALPTLIAICSIALGKPTLSSLAVLGEISISGTMIKVDELANALQVCVDSVAKKVLLPMTSAAFRNLKASYKNPSPRPALRSCSAAAYQARLSPPGTQPQQPRGGR